MNPKELARLRDKYSGANDKATYNAGFRRVVDQIFSADGTRSAPYAGVPTFLSAPFVPDITDEERRKLQVAAVGVPRDLGVSNRNGARFGPRALRTIERIGPYNHTLECTPVADLRVADIGDVPFRSRFSLEGCLADIEQF